MVHKKKMPVFWRVYIAVAVLFAVALGIWLFVLHGWLGDYESAQPKHVAEATFEKYFASFDAQQYVSMCQSGEADTLETAENVTAYLKSITDGQKITYKKVSTGLDSGYKYIVLAGEDEIKFASFTLEESEGESRFKSYTAANFEIYTDSKMRVTVEAPRGYTVLINGKELGESYITEKDIPTESCNRMPEGVSGLYYTQYTVGGLISEPTVEVKASDGTLATVDRSENAYKALPVYDKALSDEYSEWILEGAELYARYTQYDENVNVVGFNRVAPYFDPSSELYESIRTMDNMFVQYYDSFEFTDKTASEFIRYDDNTFSCRVRLTQTMYSGNDVYDDYIDQTLYLRKVDGEYLIYEMQVNVE